MTVVNRSSVPLSPSSQIVGLKSPSVNAVKAVFARTLKNSASASAAEVNASGLPALARQTLNDAGHSTLVCYRINVSGQPYYGVGDDLPSGEEGMRLRIFDGSGKEVAYGRADSLMRFAWSDPQTPKSAVGAGEFKTALSQYAAANTRAADTNLDGVLTADEAEDLNTGLALDLQDNFDEARRRAGNIDSFGTHEFIGLVTQRAGIAAIGADKNQDGYVAVAERAGLPHTLRDNFLAYAAGREFPLKVPMVDSHDLSAKSTIREHVRKFGASPVSYEDALAQAINATILDEQTSQSPRSLVALLGGHNGPITDSARLDEIMKRLTQAGSFKLLKPDQTDEFGTPAKDYWIFAVNIATGSDHGFFARVNRTTGETQVEGFN